ncbi:MAG: hypothetical protein MUF42_14000 [Cytophagaceae bacterium]|jgi:hypothetical protein|nr:hypothetical protein [Cytophagaceae bacterium]
MKPVLYIAIVFFCCRLAWAQRPDDKSRYDKEHRKGVNYEYYKNGKVKSESRYKRKIFYYYTTTYYTIKEFDMSGNLIRITKKVIQTGRREDYEKVVKEETFVYPNPTQRPTRE